MRISYATIRCMDHSEQESVVDLLRLTMKQSVPLCCTTYSKLGISLLKLNVSYFLEQGTVMDGSPPMPPTYPPEMCAGIKKENFIGVV
jgi:hypothetical protein